VSDKFEEYAVKKAGKYLGSFTDSYKKHQYSCSSGHIFSIRSGAIAKNSWCPECAAVTRKQDLVKRNKQNNTVIQDFEQLKADLLSIHGITILTKQDYYTKLDVLEVVDINGKVVKKRLSDLYRFGAGRKENRSIEFYNILKQTMSDKCVQKGWEFIEISPLDVLGRVYYLDKNKILCSKQVAYFNKNKHLNNSRCSRQEKDIRNFISSMGFKVEAGKRLFLSNDEINSFDWYFKHIPSTSKKRYCELDIFIPDKSIAIEFHGAMFHDAFGKDGEKHKRLPKFKYELCKQRGIRLIQIYEFDWTNKKDQIKSLIKNSLGIVERRVFARKCEIKEVSNDVAQSFYAQYHLKGRSPTSIFHKGLYLDKELLMVISVGKEGRGATDRYSVTRMCVKAGIQVVGGLSRLTSYILNKYKELSTLIDLLTFNGNSWITSGWKIHRVNRPTYVYFDKEKRCKVDKQKFSSVKNESTAVKNTNKYCQLWDCGKLRLIISIDTNSTV